MGRREPTGGRARDAVAERSAVPSLVFAQRRQALDDLRIDLAELETSPSYLVLSDLRPGTATAERYRHLTADVESLWPLLQAAADRLQEVYDLDIEADSATPPTKWALSSQHETTLGHYLDQRWQVVDPVSQAVLLGQTTLAELIEELRQRVESVKDATAEIENRWTDVLPRIDAARRTLVRLQGEADLLSVTEPLIGRAASLADDLAERLVADPASVHPDDGAKLDEQVGAAARQMAMLRAGHDNLADDLAETEQTLASLRVLRAHAAAAAQESREKIHRPAGLIRVPSEQVFDGPNGLAARLDQLFDLTGAWTQRRSLLDTWQSTATRLREQLEAADKANQAPIEQRNELRGRLRAYVAKMTGLGRSEDLALSELVQEGRTLLYQSPTDLAQAEATIADLAARLQA